MNGSRFYPMEKCFVCCEKLSARAKLLDCLHSLCSECVDHLIAAQQGHDDEWVKCGVCSTKTKKRNEERGGGGGEDDCYYGLRDHPYNELLIKLDNNDSSTGQQYWCGKCVEEEQDPPSPALFQCHMCNLFMCEGHSFLHQRAKATKSHVVDKIKPQVSAKLK